MPEREIIRRPGPPVPPGPPLPKPDPWPPGDPNFRQMEIDGFGESIVEVDPFSSIIPKDPPYPEDKPPF